MATRAERREYLEGLSKTEWEELTQRIGGVNLEKPVDRRIELLLNAAELPGSGDAHDRAFGLGHRLRQVGYHSLPAGWGTPPLYRQRSSSSF